MGEVGHARDLEEDLGPRNSSLTPQELEGKAGSYWDTFWANSKNSGLAPY